MGLQSTRIGIMEYVMIRKQKYWFEAIFPGYLEGIASADDNRVAFLSGLQTNGSVILKCIGVVDINRQPR